MPIMGIFSVPGSQRLLIRTLGVELVLVWRVEEDTYGHYGCPLMAQRFCSAGFSL